MPRNYALIHENQLIEDDYGMGFAKRVIDLAVNHGTDNLVDANPLIAGLERELAMEQSKRDALSRHMKAFHRSNRINSDLALTPYGRVPSAPPHLTQAEVDTTGRSAERLSGNLTAAQRVQRQAFGHTVRQPGSAPRSAIATSDAVQQLIKQNPHLLPKRHPLNPARKIRPNVQTRVMSFRDGKSVELSVATKASQDRGEIIQKLLRDNLLAGTR